MLPVILDISTEEIVGWYVLIGCECYHLAIPQPNYNTKFSSDKCSVLVIKDCLGIDAIIRED